MMKEIENKFKIQSLMEKKVMYSFLIQMVFIKEMKIKKNYLEQ